MSSVSRSTYQKLAEENKRLLADIKVLANDKHKKYDEVIGRWQEKFKKDKEFDQFIRRSLGLPE